MTASINEHYIKQERYGILAKTIEILFKNLGQEVTVVADTEVKDVGYGPQTFVNFRVEK